MTVTLYTYDWLPDFPRGFMRDLRVRWGLEEAGRRYRVETLPLQPFAQAPVIRDGDLSLFETGAILLHLAEGTPLLPERERAAITQWLFAALNTVEAASGHWMQLVLAQRMPDWFGPSPAQEVVDHARKLATVRLRELEAALAGRDWIAGDFSVADVMMVDVLRVPEAEGELAGRPALAAYVARATSRPAFRKALADHMAHWEAADVARQATVSA
jgi:glutathione S-transferase